MASRYDQQLADEEAPVLDGDESFVGVDARRSPEHLPPGFCAGAVNVEFRDGAATSRRGVVGPRWAQPGIALAGTSAFGAAAVRHPATGAEGFIVATASEFRFLQSGCDVQRIAAPSAITGRVRFSQEYGRVVAMREGAVAWIWQGNAAFVAVDDTDADDGTRPRPHVGRAENQNDRVLIEATADDVDISDIGSSEKFGITNRVRFGVAGDSLRRVFPFTNDAALIFKSRSIFLLSGVAGNLASLAVGIVNPELGLLAPDSVASTGGDVLFLSSTGVYRVTQVVQERIETAAVAVSYPIEPLLNRRVNWKAATGAVGAVWGERYYLAVPIDGATKNNAMFVFNLATNAWEGIHTFDFALDALLLADLYDSRRLWAADFAAGSFYALYEGEEDILFEDPETTYPQEVNGSVTTRGYLAGHATRKRFAHAQVAASEWHGQSSVSVSTDGNAETQSLYPVTLTRDRLSCTVAGKTWTPTNAGNEHGKSGREDYAVILEPPMVLGSGIVLNRRQEFQTRFRMQETGRYAQLTIALTRGNVAVRGVQIEGIATERALHPSP